MFCQKCGNQLNEGAVFCPKCGSRVDATSEPRVQETNGNSINITKLKKRKSTLLMCIGVIMYGLYAYGFHEFGAIFWAPCLIGLVELICAIAYKKAVFVFSIIQAVAFTFVFAYSLLIILGGHILNFILVFLFIILFPIAACALLLVGGIMYRKENAISGDSQ